MKISTTRVGRKAYRGRQTRRDTAVRQYLQRYLSVETSGLISRWKNLFSRFRRNEGLLNACKKAKTWYDISLRLSAGLRVDPLPFVRSDKDGFPRILWFVKPFLLSKSLNEKRAALTIMQLFKVHNVQGRYSLSSILSPSTAQQCPEFMEQYEIVLERMFPSGQKQERIESLRPELHISGRNGPNGPMLSTAFVDREAIRGDLESKVRTLAELTRNSLILKILDSTGEECKVNHKTNRSMSHSRIRIKYEPGGKARPFAIVDFFSQSALKPIHEFLMRRLKEEKSDGSASHATAAETVKAWTANPETRLWSFDLTTATDRWPLLLEYRAMVHCFGQEIADAWKSVIADRTFDGPSGEKVRWAVGQPLGALSSWAAFTISHHAFIRTCERLDHLEKQEPAPRRNTFRKAEEYYRIIGDDVTIALHEGIALQYKKYLGKFGVDISLSKSVVPEQTSQNAAELAKRLFISGQEVTPVSPVTIIEYSAPFGHRSLLEASLMRGYSAAGSPFPVQSTRLSRNEWALLTFPFRNLLPQLNGVKQLIPYYREGSGEAPAGLSPGWFVWGTTPNGTLQGLVQEFLLDQVRKAEKDAYQTSQTLSKTEDDQLVNIPFQGGDWQPDTSRNRDQIVLEGLKYVLNKLRGISFDLRSIIDISVYDFYEFLGKFHVFLDPKLLVFGRKTKDQKQETRILLSKVVKYCLLKKDDAAPLGIDDVRTNILGTFGVLF